MSGAYPNLIACPDCGKQVSRRAPSCPNCGCPAVEEVRQDLKPPEFPADLSIGNLEFAMTNGFTAFIENGGSTVAGVSVGAKRVLFHVNGIKIGGTLMSIF